jgi:hypothetical protein
MSAVILQRSVRLLDPLLSAAGDVDVEISGEQDNMSSPLIHKLEALIRQLIERLRGAAQYGPIPMGEMLDLSGQLRWAAEEAIRMEPTLEQRLSPDEWRRAAE